MKRKILLTSLLLGVIFILPTIVSAGPAFLCPVVGDGKDGTKGVINADSRNGENGVVAIQPPVGTSQLPGKNQAGVHQFDHECLPIPGG